MDTQQLIKERFAQLPADIQKAITSSDLAAKFTKIGDKHSLHIDQNGALQTETLLVMLGLEPGEDYVENLRRELEISKNEAEDLAEDVHTEILDAVKDSLRKLEEKETAEEEKAQAVQSIQTSAFARPAPQPIPIQTPVAPSLNMINSAPVVPPIYNDSNLKKEDVLNDLENIEKLKPQNASNFIEHLLSNPVSRPAEVETKKPEPAENKPKNTADPYREQV